MNLTEGISNPSMSLSMLVDLSFYFILAAYMIYSVVLFYHWKNYGTDLKMTTMTLTTYLVVTVPLILIMFGLSLAI